jgi:hypothetical protein
MRVSGVFRKQMEPETETIPASRLVPWAVAGLLILAGLVLYFRYGPLMSPLL